MSFESLVISLTVVNFFSILIVEQVLPRNPEMNYLHDEQTWNDIGLGILQGTSKPLMQTILIILFAVISNWRLNTFGQIWPISLPFVIQFILAFLIGTLMDYLVHRSQHTFHRLWWFHAVHHDTPQMHIMKSARLHFGEEILNSTLKPLPMILLGAPTEIVVFLGMWGVFDGNIAHSNIHQRFPSWFHYLLGTVQLHNLHHAIDRKYQDSNYSGSFPLWDILFRTFNHPDKSVLGEMGLKDNPVPPRLIDQLIFPFKAQFSVPPHPYSKKQNNY